MPTKYTCLDLFCGAGGSAMGLSQAGFSLVGIDNQDQPNYPFKFIKADAMQPPVDLSSFDFIWASPPCQAYTQMNARWRGKSELVDSHPALISSVRKMLQNSGRPYIIENVTGAMKKMIDPVALTGSMFGLGVHRPRYFESNIELEVPPFGKPPKHGVGVYGARPDGRILYPGKKTKKGKRYYRAASSLEEGQEAMGINWMNWRELCEAIPPPYAKFLGNQIFLYLEQEQTKCQ